MLIESFKVDGGSLGKLEKAGEIKWFEAEMENCVSAASMLAEEIWQNAE